MNRRTMTEHAVSIKLSAGGSVSLTFRGSLFDLLPTERQLVSTLSDTIQNFKDAAAASESLKNPAKEI